MIQLPQNAVLMIIDVQKGFDSLYDAERNNPDAEYNMVRLLETWRKLARPVVHVQHLSLNPNSVLREGSPGCEIKDEVAPIEGETLIQKHVNSAFIGTDLEDRLRRDGVDTLVIVGLTTQHCVSTTARMAGNLGFTAYVVSDATAAYESTGPDGQRYPAHDVHAISLSTIHGEFASVLTTEEVLAMAHG